MKESLEESLKKKKMEKCSERHAETLTTSYRFVGQAPVPRKVKDGY